MLGSWQGPVVHSFFHIHVCARPPTRVHTTHNIIIARKAYKLPNYGEKCKFSRLHFQILAFYQFSRRKMLRHQPTESETLSWSSNGWFFSFAFRKSKDEKKHRVNSRDIVLTLHDQMEGIIVFLMRRADRNCLNQLHRESDDLEQRSIAWMKRINNENDFVENPLCDTTQNILRSMAMHCCKTPNSRHISVFREPKSSDQEGEWKW